MFLTRPCYYLLHTAAEGVRQRATYYSVGTPKSHILLCGVEKEYILLLYLFRLVYFTKYNIITTAAAAAVVLLLWIICMKYYMVYIFFCMMQQHLSGQKTEDTAKTIQKATYPPTRLDTQ